MPRPSRQPRRTKPRGGGSAKGSGTPISAQLAPAAALPELSVADVGTVDEAPGPTCTGRSGGRPFAPCPAGQKTRRDGNDGDHRHHQDGSGEHLDHFWHGSVPPTAGAFAKYAPRSGCAVLGVGLTCRKAGAPAAISAAVRCSWACRLLAGLSADCRDHDRRRDHREPVGVLKIER